MTQKAKAETKKDADGPDLSDIPDSVPGMTKLPITIANLDDILATIAQACMKEGFSEGKASATMIACMEKIQADFSDDWPPASIMISASILKGLLAQFAKQIVIEEE